MARPSTKRECGGGNQWQDVFLDALAGSSNIAGSARKAGIGTAQAYALRRRDPEFALRWHQALCDGYELLELELLSRVRKGELKLLAPKADDKNRSVRIFDNGTALRLLLAHKDSVARHRAVQDHVDADAARASINARLEAMRVKLDAAKHNGPSEQ